MTAARIDEVEPILAFPRRDPPTVSVLAMITEMDGTDRSSRIALPADSDDAAIVHALREVAMSAAQLRGVPTDVADWYAVCPTDFTQAAETLRDWVTRQIATRRTPTPGECRDLISLLLRQTAS